MFPQQFLGGLGGTVGVPAEEGQVVIARVPNPVVEAIVAPVSLVDMGDSQGANFVEQVGVEGPTPAHRLALKTKGAGGNEFQAEEVFKEPADFALGGVEFIPQVNGGGFGGRADIGAGQFSGPSGMDIAVAGVAMGLLVDKANDLHARFQNNVFLEVLVKGRHGCEMRALTEGAGLGGGHRDDLVNMIGFGPLPARVAFGRAALFLLRGTRVGILGRWGMPAAFELALVQGL
jgi:hypothetical protein